MVKKVQDWDRKDFDSMYVVTISETKATFDQKHEGLDGQPDRCPPRGNYEQIETAANETMRVLVSTQSAAAKSIVDYRAWLMNVAHGNVIAAFDFAQNLATAKSVPDVIEYSRAHARIQFDALAAQTTELAEIAHNVARQMAEPIKTSIASAGENAA